MSTPPPSSPRPPSAGHPGLDRFFDSIRSTGIVRTSDRWIGGVAGGLARRLGVDPLLVRGIAVVLTIFFGLGLLIYGAAWLLLPEESDGRIHLQQATRGDVSAGMVGASILAVLGLIKPTSWFGWGSGASGFFHFFGNAMTALVVVAMIGSVVWLAVRSNGQRSQGAPPPAAPRGGQAPPPTEPHTSAAAGQAGPTVSSNLGETMSAHDSIPSPTDPHGQPIPTAYPAARFAPGATPYGVPTPTPVPAPAPAPPAKPTTVVKPRAKGPGAPMIAAVSGLILFVIAGAVFAARYLNWVLPDVAAAAIGTILVLIGLGLVITGLRARRSGTLGFYAIIGLIVLAPIAVGSIGTFHDDWPDVTGWRATVGDKTWQPTTVAQAEGGFKSTAGNVRVDLRGLEREPVDFTISSGAGDTTVILPEDASVDLKASSGAGNITADVPRAWTINGESGLGSASQNTGTALQTYEAGGIGQEVTINSGKNAQWTITVQSGAGNTTITTEKG